MGMDKLENIRGLLINPQQNQRNQGLSKAVDVASPDKPSVSASTSVPEKSSPSLKDVSSEFSKSLALSRELNEERVREAVEEINKELFKLQSELGFSVDKVANDIVVTVKRKESGELVRQIPSEAVLKLAHNFEKLKGVFLDDFL
ncbi:MAG: hypothetical protein CMK54_06260 [Proteobacteria bacterium]|nr:hypothetical protein [Pseudomonadota bacterium]